MTQANVRVVGFDVVAVVVFVAIGRLQHDGAGAFAPDEVLTTLWPFIAGLAVAVVVVAIARGAYMSTPVGAYVAVITAACGLALRYASGQGIAVSFAVVTTVVLGLLMLGWRLLAQRLT